MNDQQIISELTEVKAGLIASSAAMQEASRYVEESRNLLSQVVLYGDRGLVVPTGVLTRAKMIIAGKLVKVVSIERGHAHEHIAGTFTGPVTKADIEELFFDYYFGGRDAVIDVQRGTFSVIKHTD